jgi:hypothetical protein
MTKTYNKNCARCEKQTEHYTSSRSCKPCTLERKRAYDQTPKGRAKKQASCRRYMQRCYKARDMVKKLGLSIEGE